MPQRTALTVSNLLGLAGASQLTKADERNAKKEKRVRRDPAGINRLLDSVMQSFDLRNDAALARFLGIQPPVISKLRRGTYTFSPALVVRVHECTGISIRDIRECVEGGADESD